MQVASGWISARVRMIAVAALLAVMLLLPACYRMTDELVLPDAGDASQPADASEEGESASEAGVAGQAGGAAGEAGGAAGSGGSGPMDSGTGPFDGGLGDGGPGAGRFPFGA